MLTSLQTESKALYALGMEMLKYNKERDDKALQALKEEVNFVRSIMYKMYAQTL